jgi:endogenous inhibitor of DNA gyrase (YacG/DUF329 family)
VTVYHYDDTGRMSHSVTEFDADFTEADVAAALEWLDEQAVKCPGCGHPRDETMAEDAFERYDAEPLVCHRCAAIDRSRNAWREAKGDPNGIYFASHDRALNGRH